MNTLFAFIALLVTIAGSVQFVSVVDGACTVNPIPNGGFGGCANVAGASVNPSTGVLTLPTGSVCQIACSVAFPRALSPSSTVCSTSDQLTLQQCGDTCEPGYDVQPQPGGVRTRPTDLVGGSSGANSSYAYSMAISGDGSTAVVGARREGEYGAVYIYARDTSTGLWSQQSGKLLGRAPATGGTTAWTGNSVCISENGNTVMVTAPGGKYFRIYVRNPSTLAWSQQVELDGAKQGAADASAMSADGNLVAYCQYLITDSGSSDWNGGCATYTRSGTTWTQRISRIVPSIGTGALQMTAGGLFGAAAAFSGDGKTLVVAATSDSSLSSSLGAVFVVELSGTNFVTWNIRAKLAVLNGGNSQGTSVAISYDGLTIAFSSNTPVVYIFVRPDRASNVWSYQARLVATGATASSGFGRGVRLSADGDTLVAGAPSDTSSKGAVFIFGRVGTVWTQRGQKVQEDTSTMSSATQGSSIGLSNDGAIMALGAPSEDKNIGSAWFGQAAVCGPCPTGSYCPTGDSSVGCPSGRYSNMTGASSVDVCVGCPQGRYAASTGLSLCLACTNGRYTAALGGSASSSCTTANCLRGGYCTNGDYFTCAAGRYGASSGASSVFSCSACAIGKYSASTGSTICESCPTATSTGASVCILCAAGEYYSTASSQCFTCPAGSYCPDGSTQVKCNKGQYSSITGASSSSTCSSCPIGEYSSVNGASVCDACLIGKYSSNTGSSQCVDCSVGSYATTTGSTQCQQCSPGKYGDSTLTGGTSLSICLSCPIGEYCEGGAAHTPCSVGTYSSSSDASSSSTCQSCPIGSYANSTGSSICTQCPSGTYSLATGSSSSTVCTSCPMGEYCTGGSSHTSCSIGRYSIVTGASSSSTCDPCPIGEYCPTGGSTHLSCSVGSYSSTTGLSECQSCSAGSYANTTGSTQCTVCVGGKYSISTGASLASTCIDCPAGSYCAGGSSLTQCAAGRFSSVTGSSSSTVCTACPTGEYCTGGASHIGCSAGSYSTVTGASASSVCQSCSAGSYANTTGSTQCTVCVGGKYSISTGGSLSSSCMSCPMGEYCTGGSSHQGCPVGSYSTSTSLSAASQCTACSIGTYSASTGSTVCQSCPTATSTGASVCIYCTVGEYYDLSASVCVSCPYGEYCPDGALTHTPCPTGRYASSTGSSSLSQCQYCSEGQYSSTTGSSSCIDCAMGRYSSTSGSTQCLECSAGKYSTSTIGVSACMVCPLGSYCTGGSSIDDCPIGRYSNVTQLTDVTECLTCPSGRYNNDTYGMVNECKECPLGSYCLGNDSTPIVCSAGTYSLSSIDAVDNSTCLDCPLGSYCLGGSHRELCPVGSYSISLRPATCLLCPPGYTTPSLGTNTSSYCQPCPSSGCSNSEAGAGGNGGTIGLDANSSSSSSSSGVRWWAILLIVLFALVILTTIAYVTYSCYRKGLCGGSKKNIDPSTLEMSHI